MSTPTTADLAHRPEYESSRRAFPSDFPNPIDVPAGRYVDEEFFALESKYVLERSWLFAAHTDELPEPGSFLRLDAFERLGHPLFLVRGRDGVIRALYNSCRHRGGPLVTEPTGSVARHLVCKYHAWTYDLTGKLLGFPEAKNFPTGYAAECPGLRQAACDTWGPLVFVRLSGEEGPTLREFLEPVATELEGAFGDDVHFAAKREVDVDCNWKLTSDGNLEVYHVPYVHKDTASLVLDETRTGQWLLPRGHSRMLICFKHPLPERLPIQRFAGDTSLAELGIYSFHVFPNLSLVLGGPNFAFAISSLPDGPDRCRYTTHFLSPIPRTEQSAAKIDAFVDGNWAVLLEDLENLPYAQRSMRSGSTPTLRLQYQERRIRYVHEEIDRCVGTERVPLELRVPALLDDYVEER
jgi:phenylpropionate dioxygenase-like ring-hydroxylating dioxygenase large terminal subunit